MIVYKSELDLKEQLQNNSISFASAIQPITVKDKILNKVLASFKEKFKSKASLNDDDLYFHKSLFVSSNWNKNDDVFDKTEAWIARYSPIHKPTNLEHDDTQIVGHMTDAFVIDNEGNIINDDIIVDDLPDLFHICNSAVIYKFFENTAAQTRANKLIEEIEAGSKYVSMECLFSNFDYAVITPDQKYHIITRSSETAFLTKHLRVYGGTGFYQDHKIGRLLRNIIFSGKGYVDKPANENSIILNEDSIFNFGQASLNNPFILENGVLISCKGNLLNTEKQMSTDINKELETKNTELAGENTALKLSQQTMATELESTKAENKTLKTKVEELTASVTAAQAEVTTVKASATELQTKLDAATAEKTAIAGELETLKIEKVKADRVSTLVGGGFTKEVATSKVDLFLNLDDTQFTALATELIEAKKSAKAEPITPVTEVEDEVDANEANAETSLEGTESTAPATSPTVEDGAQEAEKARVALASMIEQNYFKPKKKTKTQE
jgi:hypothetical protein